MRKIDTSKDNIRFVKICLDNGVDFLLMGGAAVCFYGCRKGEGLTDLDLMPGTSPENVARLMTALRQAGVSTNKFTVEDLQKPKQWVCLKPPSYNYDLDILMPWAEWPYAAFRGRSETARVGPAEVRVLSKCDLIITKECAINDLESDAVTCPHKAGMFKAQAEKHRKDLICLPKTEERTVGRVPKP